MRLDDLPRLSEEKRERADDEDVVTAAVPKLGRPAIGDHRAQFQ